MIGIDDEGNIIIVHNRVTADLHLQRIKALINLVQQRSPDYTDTDTVYHALDLVEDMLPNEQQMRKALK